MHSFCRHNTRRCNIPWKSCPNTWPRVISNVSWLFLDTCDFVQADRQPKENLMITKRKGERRNVASVALNPDVPMRGCWIENEQKPNQIIKEDWLIAIHWAADCPALERDFCALFTILADRRALLGGGWTLAIFEVAAGKLAGPCAHATGRPRPQGRKGQSFRKRFRKSFSKRFRKSFSESLRFGQWVGDGKQRKGEKSNVELHIGWVIVEKVRLKIVRQVPLELICAQELDFIQKKNHDSGLKGLEVILLIPSLRIRQEARRAAMSYVRLIAIAHRKFSPSRATLNLHLTPL